MSRDEIQQLYGEELFNVLKEHIDEEGWITTNWHEIIEDEIPRFDENYNDNPVYRDTYQRMYYHDFEENEDKTRIRPLP